MPETPERRFYQAGKLIETPGKPTKDRHPDDPKPMTIAEYKNYLVLTQLAETEEALAHITHEKIMNQHPVIANEINTILSNISWIISAYKEAIDEEEPSGRPRDLKTHNAAWQILSDHYTQGDWDKPITAIELMKKLEIVSTELVKTGEPKLLSISERNCSVLLKEFNKYKKL